MGVVLVVSAAWLAPNVFLLRSRRSFYTCIVSLLIANLMLCERSVAQYGEELQGIRPCFPCRRAFGGSKGGRALHCPWQGGVTATKEGSSMGRLRNKVVFIPGVGSSLVTHGKGRKTA